MRRKKMIPESDEEASDSDADHVCKQPREDGGPTAQPDFEAQTDRGIEENMQNDMEIMMEMETAIDAEQAVEATGARSNATSDFCVLTSSVRVPRVLCMDKHVGEALIHILV